jgi:hypothetical protein
MTRSSTPSAEGDEPLKSGFKLFHKNDPNTVYETDLREFVLGRSEQCEIVIFPGFKPEFDLKATVTISKIVDKTRSV